MTKTPTLRIGVIIYLIYIAVFITPWIVLGADYTNLVGRDVVFTSVVLPLLLGAAVLIPAITWLGWWRPVMVESPKAGPKWTMWAVLLIMFAMIVSGLLATDWSALSFGHIALIGVGALLVGFNEEALCRGVLVVAARGSIKSEVWVCVVVSLLFGLLHAPNGFFGIGFVGASLQIVFATFAGLGFYVLRRVSGSLILPMFMHGAWDFASFVNAASGSGPAAMSPIFQFGTYLIALAAVVVVLRAGAKAKRAMDAEPMQP